jgi:hypothetical protein
LPSVHTPVEVTFAPAKPVTNSYLERQPFASSYHSLYDNSVPFVFSDIGSESASVQSGFGADNLAACLAGVGINDPLAERVFADNTGTQYRSVNLITQGNNGQQDLLAIADDSFAELGLGGTFTSASGILDSQPTLYNGFIAGGGNVLGSALATSINSDALMPFPATSSFVSMFFSIASVSSGTLEDTVAMPIDSDYAEYPSYYVTIPSVSGPATGACLAVLETGGDYSRLGPYGGLPSLDSFSLLYGSSGLQPSGVPASGFGLILAGGAALPLGSVQVSMLG